MSMKADVDACGDARSLIDSDSADDIDRLDSGAERVTESDSSVLEDLNRQCERDWILFVNGSVPQPPCFRKYMNCVEVHKKYINSIEGTAKRGHLYLVCRFVRQYFVNPTTFKLPPLATVKGARSQLINFVENASMIIPAQDELKRECKEVESAMRDLYHGGGGVNNNELARIICIIADPANKVEVGYLNDANAPRHMWDREVPRFDTVVVKRFRCPDYKAPLPATLNTHCNYSVIAGLDPNQDIDYNRTSEFVRRHYRNLRSKYSKCLRQYEISSNGNTGFWEYSKRDPLMLMMHHLNDATNGVLEVRNRRLPSDIAFDTSKLPHAPSSNNASSNRKRRPQRRSVLEELTKSIKYLKASRSQRKLIKMKQLDVELRMMSRMGTPPDTMKKYAASKGFCFDD